MSSDSAHSLSHWISDLTMASTGDISDRINLSATIGTWLGTLITGIGLIAILAQLRVFLVNMLGGWDRLKRQAGAWYPCLPKRGHLEDGSYEATLPSVTDWIQHYYLQDRYVSLVQDDVTSDD